MDGINVEARFREGVEAFERERYDWALEAFSDVVAAQPGHADAHRFMAQAYMQAEQYQEAVQSIDQALTLDPNHDLSHAVAGVLLGKYGDERAPQFFQNALQLKPERAMTYFWFGRYYWDTLHSHAEAKHWVNEALKRDPTISDAHLLLARLYEQEANLKLAEREYEDAVRMGPGNFDAMNGAGQYWLYRRHDPLAAFDYYRRAVRLMPNDDNVMRNFMLCFKEKHRVQYRLWNLHFFLNRAGKWRWMLVIGLWLMIQVLTIVADAYPPIIPFVSPIVLGYVAFCIYSWTVTPLFKFLVRRGWLR